jgi:hypothetical protein
MRPVGTLTSVQRPPSTKVTIELSKDALDLVKGIVNQTNDDPSDVFRKALALYKLALDAHKEGKHVGIAATTDNPLDTEFVGF